MVLHTPTLFFVLAALSLLATLAIWLEEQRHPGLALRYWIGAYAAAAALAISSLILFPVDPALAVLVPTVFAMMSLSLMHCGLAIHLRRRASPLLLVPIGLWLILSVLRWYGAPLEQSYHERRVVLCLAYIGYAVAIGLLLLRAEAQGWTTRALLIVFTLYGAFYVLRLIFLASNFAPYEPALGDFWVTSSICLAILLVAATAYLFPGTFKLRSESDLRHAAEIDSLTGIANRQTFRTRLSQAMRGGKAGVLALIDLDRFKMINDSCGHAVGDEVLRQFAEVMKVVAGPADLHGRLGGEEFAIVFHDEQPSGAINRLERAAVLFRQRAARGHELPFEATFSAGLVTIAPGDGLDELLVRADAALYVAKRGGRNRVEMAPDMPSGSSAGLFAEALPRKTGIGFQKA